MASQQDIDDESQGSDSNRNSFKNRFSNFEAFNSQQKDSVTGEPMSPGFKGRALRRQKSISNGTSVGMRAINVDQLDRIEPERQIDFEEINLSMQEPYPARNKLDIMGYSGEKSDNTDPDQFVSPQD